MRVKSWKKNMTELVYEDSAGRQVRCLFSYETPVAYHREGEIPRVTEKKHSATTTRHVNQWLTHHRFLIKQVVPQDQIDVIANK